MESALFNLLLFFRSCVFTRLPSRRMSNFLNSLDWGLAGTLVPILGFPHITHAMVFPLFRWFGFWMVELRIVILTDYSSDSTVSHIIKMLMLFFSQLMDLLNNEMYFISIFNIANQELGGWIVVATWIVDQHFWRGGEGRVVKHNHAINPSPSPRVSTKYQPVSEWWEFA